LQRVAAEPLANAAKAVRASCSAEQRRANLQPSHCARSARVLRSLGGRPDKTGARVYFNHSMNLPHQQRRQCVEHRTWLSYTIAPSMTTTVRAPIVVTETLLTGSPFAPLAQAKNGAAPAAV
jgi:hypothetical protein